MGRIWVAHGLEMGCDCLDRIWISPGSCKWDEGILVRYEINQGLVTGRGYVGKIWVSAGRGYLDKIWVVQGLVKEIDSSSYSPP